MSLRRRPGRGSSPTGARGVRPRRDRDGASRLARAAAIAGVVRPEAAPLECVVPSFGLRASTHVVARLGPGVRALPQLRDVTTLYFRAALAFRPEGAAVELAPVVGCVAVFTLWAPPAVAERRPGARGSTSPLSAARGSAYRPARSVTACRGLTTPVVLRAAQAPGRSSMSSTGTSGASRCSPRPLGLPLTRPERGGRRGGSRARIGSPSTGQSAW